MSVKRAAPRIAESESRFMARALALARRGAGQVEPNPMVGAVLVRRGAIVAEGYHRRFGGPHAEVDALDRCTCRTKGTTLYVTLEPCCFEGKTPACTEAIKRASLARVVVATIDPNSRVSGKGIRSLRRAGIKVDVGLLRSQAVELIAPYTTHLLQNRPYVIAKWAQSLDGKMTTATGEAKWISGIQSRRQVHLLRARVDAVLVGSGTLLHDDPLLTARQVRLRRRAARVILDSRLRTPAQCQVIDTSHQVPTMIVTTKLKAESAKAELLRRKGAEVIGCRSSGGRISTKDWMARLARRGVTNLLVEGGPTVLSSLFAARLVDEALIFTAPILIGGRSTAGAVHELGARRMADVMKAESVRTWRSGPDIVHHLRLTQPG